MKGISEIIDKYGSGNFLKKIGLKIVFNISADITMEDATKQMFKFLAFHDIKFQKEMIIAEIKKIVLRAYTLKATGNINSFSEFGYYIQNELIKLQKSISKN